MFILFLAKVIATANATAKATLSVEKTIAKGNGLRKTTIAVWMLVTISIFHCMVLPQG